MNRSFWTAATSSGLTVNHPGEEVVRRAMTAETIFNRLEEHGKTWKVYVAEPMQISFTGVIHHQRLKDRLATHFVPFAQFEADAANGELTRFLLHRADLVSGITTTTRPWGDRWATAWSTSSTPPRRSSVARRSSRGSTTLIGQCGLDTGSNVWNTALLIGWDEPGGTYDHVPPGPPCRHPIPRPRRVSMGFTFDRSGYRVPAIIVSPWVEPGEVYNEEAPAHLTDRNAARAVEPRGNPSRPEMPRPAPSQPCSPVTPPETSAHGPFSNHGRFPPFRRMTWLLGESCPRWARPSSMRFEVTQSRTTSNSKACRRTPATRYPRSRWSPCCGTPRDVVSAAGRKRSVARLRSVPCQAPFAQGQLSVPDSCRRGCAPGLVESAGGPAPGCHCPRHRGRASHDDTAPPP